MISDTWMEDIDVEVHKNNRSIETQTAQITSDTQANKQLILAVLKNIDFYKSRLPKEFLSKKKNPEQLYGDFQLKIYTLIQKMETDNSLFEMDITEIDRYLFLMAKVLAGAIESGCQGTASSARMCLSTGFLKVRANCLVLQNDESRKQYLENAVKYLNNCYLYISVKNMMDITQQNLERRKKSMQEEVQHLEEAKDHLTDMVLSNPEMIGQMQAALHTTYKQAGYTWSASMHQLYETLVQFRISESKLHYEGLLLDMETKKMFVYQDIANKLKSLITTIPEPVDVNLMEKFRHIIGSSMEESTRVDQDTVRLDDIMSSFESSLQSMPSDDSHQVSFMAKTYQKLEETAQSHRKSSGASDEDADF